MQAPSAFARWQPAPVIQHQLKRRGSARRVDDREFDELVEQPEHSVGWSHYQSDPLTSSGEAGALVPPQRWPRGRLGFKTPEERYALG